MKKVLAVLLSLVFVLSLAACGNNNENNVAGNGNVVETVDPVDATDLLTQVWNYYAEEEKFAAMGGDYVTMVENAPGKFDISDTESLDAMLGVPADAVASIDDTASLVHMMNANTFTAGAYHMVDGEDVTAFIETVKENIMNRQWMCGFPDKLVFLNVNDEYIVSIFGATDVVDTFVDKFTEYYGTSLIVSDDSLAQ